MEVRWFVSAEPTVLSFCMSHTHAQVLIMSGNQILQSTLSIHNATVILSDKEGDCYVISIDSID